MTQNAMQFKAVLIHHHQFVHQLNNRFFAPLLNAFSKIIFFPQELQFFDRSSMTGEQLAQLKEIIESPLFEPEAVREVSRACESLCRWIRAMYECCLLQHNVLLKKQLEAQAGSARRMLHLLKKREREADNSLENYEQQLRNIRNELQDLQRQLYKAEDEGEEATRCAVRVAMLYQNWRALFQVIQTCFLNPQFLQIVFPDFYFFGFYLRCGDRIFVPLHTNKGTNTPLIT